MVGIPAIEPYPMPTLERLPVNIANWQVDADRAVLLVHDMQRYFLQPFPEHDSPRAPLVHHATLLRNRCAELGIPVAYTAQPGGMSTADRGLLKDFWGPGMRLTPIDREIIDPLAPVDKDWQLTKWRYSAFFRSDLLNRLREHGRDQLLLCGVYAHIGVLTTAVEAFSNDIETFLVADAIADFTPESHRLAIDYAASNCAVVTTTSRLLDQLAADRHQTAPGRHRHGRPA